MDYLPLFLKLDSQYALVFGGGDAALRKCELLLKAGCHLWLVTGSGETGGIAEFLAANPRVKVITQADAAHWQQALLVVAAEEDPAKDLLRSNEAKARHTPVNVVNNAELSTFIFPSIIDRSPIIAAVASGGEMPVLSRLLRSQIETSLPHGYGRLATLAARYKDRIKALLPELTPRRRLWERLLEGRFAELVFSGREHDAAALIEAELKDVDAHKSAVGEVYLVGAGPGDPDLLSFKALRLMRQADVVLFDRLVSEPILALTRQDAEKINVGKERSNHLVPQESINDLLVHYARQGKRVLRLKGGDPFIFGRGGEEIEKLAEQGIPFQIVPGVTAASGCAAYSGIPLTHRDYSQSVRFITAHLKNDTCDLPWHEFIHAGQTLVFYMGLTGLPVICRELIAHGMSTDKPVALISKGTTPEQTVLTGTLANIQQLASQSEVRAPTLIIIGDVVRLRDKLAWQ